MDTISQLDRRLLGFPVMSGLFYYVIVLVVQGLTVGLTCQSLMMNFDP